MAARADRFADLPTEAVLPGAERLDLLPPAAIVKLLAREEKRSVAAVARAAGEIAAVAGAATRALEAGGRLVYAGAGTSGRLATLDAAECLPTFGVLPGQVVAVMAGGARALRQAVEGAEDRGPDAERALARLRVDARDRVVGLAASGVTPFVHAALAGARARGATTALVTCNPRVAASADHVVRLDVGPEVLAGSTRLKAGTATKLALNAISTAAMIGLGKTYGPRMVDLVATNDKLRARARRIVVELTGLAPAAAGRLLARAGGRVKTAVVMARTGSSRREAERRLVEAGGHLRRVIG